MIHSGVSINKVLISHSSEAVEALKVALEAIAGVLGNDKASKEISGLPAITNNSSEAPQDFAVWLLHLGSSENLPAVASRLPAQPRRFLIDWLDAVSSTIGLIYIFSES